MENNKSFFASHINDIIESSDLGLWDWHMPEKTVYLSKTFEKLLGYKGGEISPVEDGWLKFVHPSDRECADDIARRFKTGEISEFDFDARMIKKDGSFFWANLKGLIAEKSGDEAGNPPNTPKRCYGLMQDISKKKKTEEMLCEKISQLNIITKTSGLGTWDFNLKTYTTEYNDEYLSMLGYERSEIKGTYEEWVAFYHPDDYPQANRAIRDYISGVSDSYSVDVRLRHKDGHYIWTHETATIYEWDESGVPIRVLGGQLNVDRLKNSEERLRLALEELEKHNVIKAKMSEEELNEKEKLVNVISEAASLLMTADDGNFDETFEKCIMIMGKTFDADRFTVWKNVDMGSELGAKNLYGWFKDINLKGLDEFVYKEVLPSWVELLSEGKSINQRVKDMPLIEKVYLFQFHVKSVLAVPIFLNNEWWGFIGFDDCKGERVFTETEQRAIEISGPLILNALLRNEITQNLIESRENAISSAKAKSDFVASISHEIRTPMNAIIGMTDILEEDELTERQKRYVSDIKMSALSLLEIINGILDFSKIERGMLTLMPHDYDFGQLLDNVASMILFSCQRKSISFVVDKAGDLPNFLYGDSVRLRQILINVLGNAVKYTERGIVRFAVEIANKFLRFTISDTGSGIKEVDLEKIFAPFERFDSENNISTVGTGLGLAITHNLVALMKGTIEVKSKYGEGTVFEIQIPMKLGKRVRIENYKAFGYITAPEAEILVVDDNEVNLRVAEGLLKLCDITPTTALSGEEAIEIVRSKDFDMVFMDQMMPGMDGIETTQKIRELGEEYKSLPIIALTANAIKGAKEHLLANNLDDFLAKPIDKKLLVEKLQKWLPADKIKAAEQRKNESQAYSGLELSEALRRVAQIGGIDINLGLSRIGGSTDSYEKVIQLFYKTMPTDREKMKKHLENFELANFCTLVHGMKGALANIGITALSEQAAQIEKKARECDVSFCELNFPAFDNALDNLYEALNSIFEGVIRKTPPSDKSDLFSRLEQIRVDIEFFQLDAALENLYALKELSFGEKMDAAINELFELGKDLDYDGISSGIEKIMPED